MKTIRISAISAAALIICSIVLSGCCSNGNSAAEETASVSGTVIDNIMTRRSIRQYKPQAVGRDTMHIILNCGINAPNGQNKQSWEVRVVDNPEYIAGITAAYVKENPAAAEDPTFVNMFRNAPTVVFIANDPSYDGGPARFMNTSPAAADFVKKLGFSEGYELLLCIGFGYPDEAPAAKPRDASKVRFID